MNNENIAPTSELTDAQIPHLVPTGDKTYDVDSDMWWPTPTRHDEIRLARAAIAADRALRASPAAGDVAMPVMAWLRIKPSDMEDFDEFDFSANEQLGFTRPLVRLADAQAALAAKDAEIAARAAYANKQVEEVQALRELCANKDVRVGANYTEIAKLTAERDALRKYAAIGKVAIRFVDRAGDVHPGIDDAETICAEFYTAMTKEPK